MFEVDDRMITIWQRKRNHKGIGHINSAALASYQNEMRRAAMSCIGISRAILVWSLAVFLAQPAARAQEEKFDEVNFPLSSSAAAQTQFNRPLPCLHSLSFPEPLTT